MRTHRSADHERCLLALSVALPGGGEDRHSAGQAIFQAAFREYGMPQAIRTDNGAPFASRSLQGLSRLSVWLIKLGMVPERIQPAHPEQNGRHERMHLTLQQETMSPMAANRRAATPLRPISPRVQPAAPA